MPNHSISQSETTSASPIYLRSVYSRARTSYRTCTQPSQSRLHFAENRVWTRHFWLWSYRVDVLHIVRGQHLQRKHWISKCLIATKRTQSVCRVHKMYCDTNYVKWWTISVWNVRFLRDPCTHRAVREVRYHRHQQNTEITREKLHIVVVSLRRRLCRRYIEGVCARSTVCVFLCIVCVNVKCSATLYLYSITVQPYDAHTYIVPIQSEEKKKCYDGVSSSSPLLLPPLQPLRRSTSPTS